MIAESFPACSRLAHISTGRRVDAEKKMRGAMAGSSIAQAIARQPMILQHFSARHRAAIALRGAAD